MPFLSNVVSALEELFEEVNSENLLYDLPLVSSELPSHGHSRLFTTCICAVVDWITALCRTPNVGRCISNINGQLIGLANKPALLKAHRGVTCAKACLEYAVRAPLTEHQLE